MKRPTLTPIAVTIATAGLFLVVQYQQENLHDLHLLHILLQLCLLAGSIYLLGVGADYLVNASSRLARRLGISELIIGLTVVAFGTSAPELAASLVAGFEGGGDIAIGNVVGSNIFNVCFILGLVALLTRGGLTIDRSLIRRDGPMVLLGTILVFLAVGSFTNVDKPAATAVAPLNLHLEWAEGLILLLGLVAYLFWLYLVRKGGPTPQHKEDPPAPAGSIVRDLLLVTIGLVMVLAGSQLLVGAAETHGIGPDIKVDGFGSVWFAKLWGIPDYVVGLTIIAAGTSAPEMVVSLVAALKGSADISTGNLLGSVVFNLFGVVGAAGLLVQPPLGEIIAVSPDVVPNLIGLSGLLVIIIVFMMTGRRIARWEGAVLFGLGIIFWIVDFILR
ncbi:calcium/sodium antiporter [candidate division GN15 bacterium]|nr:calcium/sodium antiporter [candidate division GN15 bacterium]